MFEGGVKNGFGSYVYTSGDRFKGTFVNGVRTGKVTLPFRTHFHQKWK